MTAYICPCCDQPVRGLLPVKALKEAHFSPHQRVIVEKLIDAYPRSVARDVMVNHLYQLDPDGGPEDALSTLSVQLTHVRARLRKHGWTVKKPPKGGSTPLVLMPI